MFDDLPDTMRAAFWWALSGAVGAAIVAFNDRHMKPVPLLIALFTGAAVAAYGVPVVSHFLKIESQNVMLAFAFFLGVGAKPIIRRVARQSIRIAEIKGQEMSSILTILYAIFMAHWALALCITLQKLLPFKGWRCFGSTIPRLLLMFLLTMVVSMMHFHFFYLNFRGHNPVTTFGAGSFAFDCAIGLGSAINNMPKFAAALTGVLLECAIRACEGINHYPHHHCIYLEFHIPVGILLAALVKASNE